MIKKLLFLIFISIGITGCEKDGRKTYVVVDQNNDTTYVQGLQSYTKQGTVVIITKSGAFSNKKAYFSMTHYKRIYELY